MRKFTSAGIELYICNSRPQKGFVKLPEVINMQLLLKISIH